MSNADRLVNLALVLWATVLTAHAMAGKGAARFWPLMLVGGGCVALMHATGLTLFIGQTSELLYIGFAAIIYGVSTGNRSAFAAGLVAVALKPNVGAVVFLVVVTMMPEWRRTLVLAALNGAGELGESHDGHLQLAR